MKNSETRKKASETKKKLFLSGKLKISKKCKEKHREKHKGKTYEEIHGKEKALKLKKQRRYIAIQRVEKQKLNGKPLTPLHGKYEKNILDNLEKSLGFKIQRQKRVAGYFLDGYIPSLNLAIEIDEPHHFTFNNKLKNKDISRQKEIEQEIRCQFLRIKISKGVKN